MKHLKNKIMAFSNIAIISTCFFAVDVSAQMNESPWGFKGQNRASIAALMRQVETESSGGNIISTGTGSVTTLVCGGSGGDASATGTSSCIILNNSDADIMLGQEASGNQDANSEVTETVNVEEVLSILSGEETAKADIDGLDSLIE